ncbi:MAG: DUF1905 domain-containing protein [Parcubacteria group bacterium]|nr:DUF1905 domain-containing protein [Parcubacteria group bacterium]
MTHSTRAKVWLHASDKAAWHFVTLSNAVATKLEKEFKRPRRGWGSIPIQVTIGKSVWKTSIFPNKKSGGLILPIKSKVRKAEGVSAGDTVSFIVEVDRWR